MCIDSNEGSMDQMQSVLGCASGASWPKATDVSPHNASSLLSKKPISIPKDMPLARLSQSTLTEFARDFPKIDLHRHLEGAITPALYLELSHKHDLPRPADSVAGLRPHMEVSSECQSLKDFLSKFELTQNMFRHVDVITDATEGVIQAADADNVKYLELRFAPMFMGQAHNIAPKAVIDAVIAGVKKAQTHSAIKVNLLLIIERDKAPAVCEEIVQYAQAYQSSGVVGIDLAGDEASFPPGRFASLFQQAKANGVNVTVHAGEAAGAENVAASVEGLGATRIGHGVRAIEDPVVVQLLRTRGVTLELCPTSNVQTGAVPSLSSHPLRQFLDNNVKVTINTDDPALSGIDHSHEILLSINQFNLSMAELMSLTHQAIESSFLSDGEKASLHEVVKDDMERAWLALGSSS